MNWEEAHLQEGWHLLPGLCWPACLLHPGYHSGPCDHCPPWGSGDTGITELAEVVCLGPVKARTQLCPLTQACVWRTSPGLIPDSPCQPGRPCHLQTIDLMTVITPNLFFKSLINSKSSSIFKPLNHSHFSCQGHEVGGRSQCSLQGLRTPVLGTDGCSSLVGTCHQAPDSLGEMAAM